jgi:predicted site-specific integrase-resolvase
MSTEIFATQETPKLLSPRELAGVLGLCPDSVRRATKRGLISCVRIGGAIRYRPEDVEKVMSDGFAWPKCKTN